jgi:hypothetical protein
VVIGEIAMSLSAASNTRHRHPGLPTEQLFKLFRAAIKDEGNTRDHEIQSTYEDIVSYDRERARSVMELIVRRHETAWNALNALLAEACDAQSGIVSECYREHILH